MKFVKILSLFLFRSFFFPTLAFQIVFFKDLSYFPFLSFQDPTACEEEYKRGRGESKV